MRAMDTSVHHPGIEELICLAANAARQRALPRRSGLAVGCAVVTPGGKTFFGANIETQWQTSYHSEEVAILGMLMAGEDRFDTLCIAAERELFTPCGACMDKILEFGGPNAVIYHYRPSTKDVRKFTAKEIMPHYPTRE